MDVQGQMKSVEKEREKAQKLKDEWNACSRNKKKMIKDQAMIREFRAIEGLL